MDKGEIQWGLKEIVSSFGPVGVHYLHIYSVRKSRPVPTMR